MLTWHGRVAGLWCTLIARILSFGKCAAASPTFRNRLSTLAPQHVMTMVQHASRGKTVTCRSSSLSSSSSNVNRSEQSSDMIYVQVSLENRIHLCDTLWQRIDVERIGADVPSGGSSTGGSGGKGSGRSGDPLRLMSPNDR